MVLAVEIVGAFDYQELPLEQRVFVQQRTSEVCSLLRQQLYNAVEVGQKLLEVKERISIDRVYRQWIESEFPWGKSAASRFEHVAICFANVPNWDKVGDRFDLSALYVLSAPSTPTEVREKALALAESGERVSHARAKALRDGSDTTLIQPGMDVTVTDEDSPHHGQQVTVKAVDKKDGIVHGQTKGGEKVDLLLSEVVPPQPVPVPKEKPQPNDQVAAMSVSWEIDKERLEIVEDMLRRVCVAARAGKLSDKLLTEAESLLA